MEESVTLFLLSASALLLNSFLLSEIQKVSCMLSSSNLCAFEKIIALSLCNGTTSWTWKKKFLVQADVTLSRYWLKTGEQLKNKLFIWKPRIIHTRLSAEESLEEELVKNPQTQENR